MSEKAKRICKILYPGIPLLSSEVSSSDVSVIDKEGHREA